jgi:cytochrome c oxidase assembly protein subunit 15
MVAYLLVLLTIVWTFLSFKTNTSALFRASRLLPLTFIILQLVLGIMTVLFSLQIRANQWGTFEWMAQLHQVVALFFLMSLALNLYMLTGKEKSKNATAIDPHVI